MPSRVVVLLSGTGTLLQSLLDAAAAGELSAQIVGVISDQPYAVGLLRADMAGIPTAVVPLWPGVDRSSWDSELTAAVSKFEPDLVVSAGFMKILGPGFLAEYAGRTINSHPSLLPAFPGAHAVRDSLATGVKVSGATVFYVDAGVDTGPIIAQEAVRVAPDDTVDADLVS